ncbi:GIY-YIG nuclease family protein [Salinicola halimionae]|uniref:GIY-YIG nuclease family protein n=1 Tax=Salinicola halimionae TaxID=1949081 RepID=UPI000DA211D2|nr:GIY-YIG nuclease family protein [Salinicola halimionae]
MERVYGRKIVTYMIDGTPTGPKTIEIGNWSGKAIYTPRGSLKSVLSRSELQAPGVYLLRSESSDSDFDGSIYIGEAEKLNERLNHHSYSRDFESAICFLSKDDMLTKAHVKYLESRLVSLAKEANRSAVQNGITPPQSRISEADISDMEFFLDQIKLILPTVGINTLVPAAPHSKSQELDTSPGEIYSVKASDIKATMKEAEDAFIVLKGSEARLTTTDSIAPGWLKLRAKLIDEGVLVAEAGHFIFTENASFSSPSAASSVVLGRQAPGPISWVTASGVTYKEVKESQSPPSQENLED